MVRRRLCTKPRSRAESRVSNCGKCPLNSDDCLYAPTPKGLGLDGGEHVGRGVRSTPCRCSRHPMMQRHFRQPMSDPRQVCSGGFSGADQIPDSVLGRTRNPHRHNLVQPQQPRQIRCVTRIGLPDHPPSEAARMTPRARSPAADNARRARYPRDCVSEAPASNYSTPRGVTTYGLRARNRHGNQASIRGPAQPRLSSVA
ncbi:hypothetical protein LAUMK35_02924 [Mycobacterium pseudokansasii]|nr:hypothetical protein LAUMK35_02924 [Mycobacterium pseudokansasii]VAZ96548.1 hypothetical protein LAUMK21_02925 [Mycobacterium pseudokansasii]